MKKLGRLTKTTVLASIVLVVAMLAGLTACDGGETVTTPVTDTEATPAPEKALTLKLLHHYSPPEAATGTTPIFIDRVNAKAGGKLVIELTGGTDVIPLLEQFPALEGGIVDLLATPFSIWSSQVPQMEILNFTKVKSTGASDPALERETGIYDYINDALKEHNLYMLGRIEVLQPWYVFTNKEVNNLNDLAKTTLGTGSGRMQRYLKELIGVEPVNVQPPDLYTSLERSMVDGIVCPVSMYAGFSIFEVAPYVIMPPYVTYGSIAMVMKLDTWNSLAPDIQDILEEAIIFTESYEESIGLGREEMNLQQIYDQGVMPVQLNEADIERFIRVNYDSNWETLKDRVSPELYEEMRTLSAKTWE